MPAIPSQAFIAECKYWQLDNLLRAVELADIQGICFCKPDNHSFELKPFHKDGRNGFRLQGRICRFIPRLEEANPICVPFSAYGTDWQLEVKKAGAFLVLVKGPPCKQPEVTISFGPSESPWRSNSFPDRDLTAGEPGWGTPLSAAQLLHLQHPPYMDLSGSLLVGISLVHRKATGC